MKFEFATLIHLFSNSYVISNGHSLLWLSISTSLVGKFLGHENDVFLRSSSIPQLTQLSHLSSLISFSSFNFNFITQLLQAGFPLCLWPYAARTYSMLENVRVRTDGTCPWSSRFGEEPNFQQLPLGCLIWFVPAKTKYEQSPAAPRLVPGVFMGYRTSPGGRFGGEYICVDLFDFKGISLAQTTRHTKFRFREHYVQKIVLDNVVSGYVGDCARLISL